MPPTLHALGLDRLPRADRLALVQDLWDSIAAETPALPDARRRKLERRADEDADAPDDVVPWEQVKVARHPANGPSQT